MTAFAMADKPRDQYSDSPEWIAQVHRDLDDLFRYGLKRCRRCGRLRLGKFFPLLEGNTRAGICTICARGGSP